MTHTTLFRIAASGLIAGLALRAQVGVETAQKQQPAVRYRLTDLGTLGGTYSYAFGINNAGEVAGAAATPGQIGGLAQTAFVWFRGHMRNLGTLGGKNSAASGVNAWGEAAILSETSDQDPDGEDVCAFGTHAQCHAAIWNGRELIALPSLRGGRNAFAINVNDRGQVIGSSENGVRDSTCSSGTPNQVTRFEAVLWQSNGKPQELLPLPGDTVGFAFGINNKGQVTGGSGSCSDTALPPATNGRHAVLWERDGTPIDLGDLGGGAFNVATSINNRGEVAGTSLSAKDGVVHAFLWTKETGMQDYGAFPGAFLTVPPCCNTLNDRGEMAGFAIDPNGNSRALVWVNKVPVDLNTLIPQNSGWYLQAAESVNDDGQIAGYGLIDGNVHAFLAMPVRD
jgi:probable HAF family extracellular repeat protein